VAFKIAIIGLGKIAEDQHLPVIAKSKDFQLVATVSQRGLSQPGIPTFRTPAELYARIGALDVVAICTPPSVRHQIARDAINAGKHVLLEKPPTQTVAELFDLASLAKAHDKVVFTTWHSQYNRAVGEAKKQLAKSTVRSLHIEWKEDVRRWHPGQEWIWQPGGFGVFDPGINALSIVTKIMPRPIFIAKAELSFPSNRDTPIAAALTFKAAGNDKTKLTAEFDWRQTGEQSWNITIESEDRRTFELSKGGARLAIDGTLVADEQPVEYEAIYRDFAGLLARNESHVDFAPLQLVADSFMLARRLPVEPFNE
jgi:D-galactose 1-dehydrogenase